MTGSRNQIGPFPMFAACATLVVAWISPAWDSHASEESLASRRERLEAMPPPERDRLVRNQQRFEQMPESEQDQLRELHAEIERDRQSEHLKQIMHRYQAWLKTLPTSQRAELNQLSNDERIERIKKWQAEEQQERSRRLGIPDLRVYLAWLEQRVLASLSANERDAIKALPNDRQRRQLIRSHLEESRGRNRLRPPSPEEIESLKKDLSPPAQQAMTDALGSGRDELRKLLYSWYTQTRGGIDDLRMPHVKTEDLVKYFDSLSERDRDGYLSLPPDEMWQRLEWRYRREQISGRPGRRSGGPQGNSRPDRREDTNRAGERNRQPERPALPKDERAPPGSV